MKKLILALCLGCLWGGGGVLFGASVAAESKPENRFAKNKPPKNEIIKPISPPLFPASAASVAGWKYEGALAKKHPKRLEGYKRALVRNAMEIDTFNELIYQAKMDCVILSVIGETPPEACYDEGVGYEYSIDASGAFSPSDKAVQFLKAVELPKDAMERLGAARKIELLGEAIIQTTPTNYYIAK